MLLTDRQSVTSMPLLTMHIEGKTMRIIKTPQERRADIIQAAQRLFHAQGYADTSVDEIVREAQIAKGTFYYYFKSKPEVLAALAQQLIAEMAAQAKKIADAPSLDAVEKLCRIIRKQNDIKDGGEDIVQGIHEPANRELHDRLGIETVLTLGPVFAQVIEQGNREGIFQVADPLSTMQFILAGADSLLGHNAFNWTPAQQHARLQAMLILIERALGAAAGSVVPALMRCLSAPTPS